MSMQSISPVRIECIRQDLVRFPEINRDVAGIARDAQEFNGSSFHIDEQNRRCKSDIVFHWTDGTSEEAQ